MAREVRLSTPVFLERYTRRLGARRSLKELKIDQLLAEIREQSYKLPRGRTQQR
jgi:hypothetical protein